MKTGLHQHAALRQDLRINPRLYQAMDLLYMPLLDLEQHLKQELLGNPFLEMIEPEEEVQATAADQQQNKPEKEAKAEDGPDWESILLEDRTEHGVPSGSYSDAREYVEPVTVESKDLIDHLRDQTRMLDQVFALDGDRLDVFPGVAEAAARDAVLGAVFEQNAFPVGPVLGFCLFLGLVLLLVRRRRLDLFLGLDHFEEGVAEQLLLEVLLEVEQRHVQQVHRLVQAWIDP